CAHAERDEDGSRECERLPHGEPPTLGMHGTPLRRRAGPTPEFRAKRRPASPSGNQDAARGRERHAAARIEGGESNAERITRVVLASWIRPLHSKSVPG